MCLENMFEGKVALLCKYLEGLKESAVSRVNVKTNVLKMFNNFYVNEYRVCKLYCLKLLDQCFKRKLYVLVPSMFKKIIPL